ncbi:hypothetical protein AVEN_218648-1 [Araneus ventricosus]|uniref:Uncharacterized protein n=1 Tax=Araneus ventricosus TaxID=182803 RepID=A0A4Y2B513_ARAVE|nr:hypothetical protein AVEN_218648-1 [Araneus ventricosus]
MTLFNILHAMQICGRNTIEYLVLFEWGVEYAVRKSTETDVKLNCEKSHCFTGPVPDNPRQMPQCCHSNLFILCSTARKVLLTILKLCPCKSCNIEICINVLLATFLREQPLTIYGVMRNFRSGEVQFSLDKAVNVQNYRI